MTYDLSTWFAAAAVVVYCPWNELTGFDSGDGNDVRGSSHEPVPELRSRSALIPLKRVRGANGRA